jgi:processing peptidase subunit alpha
VLQVTTLPDGLRVATESMPGHFAALGVYANAGSRYEHAQTMGASHLLDRMSYCVNFILLLLLKSQQAS